MTFAREAPTGLVTVPRWKLETLASSLDMAAAAGLSMAQVLEILRQAAEAARGMADDG